MRLNRHLAFVLLAIPVMLYPFFNVIPLQNNSIYLQGVPVILGQSQDSTIPRFDKNGTFTLVLSNFVIAYRYESKTIGVIAGREAIVHGNLYLDKTQYLLLITVESRYQVNITTSEKSVILPLGAKIMSRTYATPEDVMSYLKLQTTIPQSLTAREMISVESY